MTNPYRVMCAELIDALEGGIPAERLHMSPLADRARALLDQPVAEEPTIPSSTLHRQELTPSEVTLLNTFWRSR
jgi:hypothetical protein